MINKENGEVTFPDWEFILSPRTTRSDFLKSSLAHQAIPELRNEPYASWKILHSRWQDKWWTVGIRFNVERLFSIMLETRNDEIGPNGEYWSRESERKFKEYHSTVLAQIIGASRREFTWGVVESYYEEGGVVFYIHIECK